MGKIKIRFHPLFFLFAIILIFFGQAFLFFNYLLVLFLHEFAHAIVAKGLGYEINNISLYPFGICLNMESKNILPNDEIKIAIAGPTTNLFLCVCLLSLWWLFPGTYSYTYYFCFANFVTALINFLPVFPLDGGRVFLAMLNLKVERKKSIVLCKILNIFISVLMLILFFLTLLYSVNLTFLLMAVFIFIGIFDKNENDIYNFINIDNKLKFKNKFCKVKQVAITEDMQIFRLSKFINNHTITEFIVVSEDRKIKFRFSEFELINIYEKMSPISSIGSALSIIKVGF